MIKKMARIGFFSSRRLKSSLQNVKSNYTESNIKTNIRRNRSGITEVLGEKARTNAQTRNPFKVAGIFGSISLLHSLRRLPQYSPVAENIVAGWQALMRSVATRSISFLAKRGDEW